MWDRVRRSSTTQAMLWASRGSRGGMWAGTHNPWDDDDEELYAGDDEYEYDDELLKIWRKQSPASPIMSGAKASESLSIRPRRAQLMAVMAASPVRR